MPYYSSVYFQKHHFATPYRTKSALATEWLVSFKSYCLLSTSLHPIESSVTRASLLRDLVAFRPRCLKGYSIHSPRTHFPQS